MPKVFEQPKEPEADKSGFVRTWNTEVTDAPDFVPEPPRALSRKTMKEQAAGRKALEPYYESEDAELEPEDKAKG